jgi:hypothetical protein
VKEDDNSMKFNLKVENVWKLIILSHRIEFCNFSANGFPNKNTTHMGVCNPFGNGNF